MVAEALKDEADHAQLGPGRHGRNGRGMDM
jgi:hypothetical protein